MRIGVPTEIKCNEFRVGLVPASVRELVARGHEVVHLIRPGVREPHRLFEESDVRDGRLYVCGSLVA
jgi:hypothetical protein